MTRMISHTDTNRPATTQTAVRMALASTGAGVDVAIKPAALASRRAP